MQKLIDLPRYMDLVWWVIEKATPSLPDESNKMLTVVRQQNSALLQKVEYHEVERCLIWEISYQWRWGRVHVSCALILSSGERMPARDVLPRFVPALPAGPAAAAADLPLCAPPPPLPDACEWCEPCAFRCGLSRFIRLLWYVCSFEYSRFSSNCARQSEQIETRFTQ